MSDPPNAPETELLGPADHRARLVKRFTLTVTDGADAGLRAVSSGERMVLGTHESCDLVLTDRTVSRFQCEITLTDDGPSCRDLGSRNGTFVEGIRLGEGIVASTCVLTVGKSKVRFELGEGSVSVPLSGTDRLGRLVGRSPCMRAAFALIERAAESDVTVLLTGETGTGKEAAAETLHALGPRRDEPLVVVDCGAIPANLLESELFGHERGAFTGAVEARRGAFELASGGTIFLDEIGELAPDLQPKLLRALDQRAVKRVGGSAYKPVDVRVIAATSRDLRAEINSRRFRSDLYYRLAVLEVRLPPLRERREDLPLLVEHLLTEIGASGRSATEAVFEEGFLDGLTSHRWPGNVRELRNYVERALALGAGASISQDGMLDPAGAASQDDGTPDFSLALPHAREKWNRGFERKYLEHMLRLHQDNVSAAARASGVGRIYFYRRLVLHGLR